MKFFVNFAIPICLVSIFINCSPPENPIKTTPTSVNGHVMDFERGFAHPNYKVVLTQLVFGGGGWSGYGYTGEHRIDSTYTNDQGYFEFNFNYDLDLKYKYTLRFDGLNSAEGPFSDFLESYIIEPGDINTMDINHWLPNYLKLNLSVSNNFTQRLGITNTILNDNFYHFRGGQIFEEEIDTTIYLPNKPNADIRLNFYYSTGNSNSDAHRRFEFLSTTLQDTLELSFVIDCSLF